MAQEERSPEERGGVVSHIPGRVHHIRLTEGDHLRAGTCGVEGARVEGDTILQLSAPSGEVVAFNDDGCGGLGSHLSYHVPRSEGGEYSLTALCYPGSECGGRIGYQIEQVGVPSGVRISTTVRAMVGVDSPGAGALADTTLQVHTLAPLAFRLELGPVGLAGGANGGLFGGSAMLTAMVDWDWMAVGIGAGIGVLGRRRADLPDQEAPLLGLRTRVGDLRSFRLSGELRGAFADEEFRTHSFRVELRIPFDAVELVFRGAGGDDGVALGEAALVIWVDRAPNRPRFGVSVHVGGAAVFYESLCRFGNPCAQTRVYLGPVLGAGVEWRP